MFYHCTYSDRIINLKKVTKFFGSDKINCPTNLFRLNSIFKQANLSCLSSNRKIFWTIKHIRMKLGTKTRIITNIKRWKNWIRHTKKKKDFWNSILGAFFLAHPVYWYFCLRFFVHSALLLRIRPFWIMFSRNKVVS